MKRIVVIQNRDGSVSCLPMTSSKWFYEQRHTVLAYCNRLWNPYHVGVIKSYFSTRGTTNE